VGERPQRRDTARGAWIRADPRGGDGGIRYELAQRLERLRSLARSASSPSLGSTVSECAVSPSSEHLTPYSIRGTAHSRHCGGKLVLAATERFCPIANLARFVHAYRFWEQGWARTDANFLSSAQTGESAGLLFRPPRRRSTKRQQRIASVCGLPGECWSPRVPRSAAPAPSSLRPCAKNA
jgi:hypothetical protein